MKPTRVNRDSYIIEDQIGSNQEGTEIAEEAANLMPEEQVRQANEAKGLMTSLGDSIMTRLKSENRLSFAQARDLRNQAAAASFSAGGTFAERMAGANKNFSDAATQAAVGTRQEAAEMLATAQYTQKANMMADLQMGQFKAQARRAQLETETAVKQGKQGLDLAQQELMNEFLRLRVTAQNADALVAMEASQQQIDFAFQMAGVGLKSVEAATAGLASSLGPKPAGVAGPTTTGQALTSNTSGGARGAISGTPTGGYGLTQNVRLGGGRK